MNANLYSRYSLNEHTNWPFLGHSTSGALLNNLLSYINRSYVSFYFLSNTTFETSSNKRSMDYIVKMEESVVMGFDSYTAAIASYVTQQIQVCYIFDLA